MDHKWIFVIKNDFVDQKSLKINNFLLLNIIKLKIQDKVANQRLGFPSSSNGKASAYNAGDLGSIPGSGRSRGGHGNPLQYSCLENFMDRGAWCTTIHEVAESDTLRN